MGDFFAWLSQNPIAGSVLMIAFGAIVVSLMLIYLVAFFQGREIVLWPPKIGAKSEDEPKVTVRQLDKVIGTASSINIKIPRKLQNQNIRFSISGLFRIRLDDKYFLVLGDRIKRYQPVGGVFKRLPRSFSILTDLGVRDDDKIPIDNNTQNDLRIRIEGRYAPRLLKWFCSRQGRELCPWREFYEELIEPGILPAERFPFIHYEYIKTYVSNIQFSEYFQCNEIFISEIYELVPNNEQIEALRMTQSKKDQRYTWRTEQEIRSQGVCPPEKLENDISEIASWIL